MKRYLLFIILVASTLFASNNSDKEKQKRLDKQIQINMETEKKYAIEQTFYNAENYDFKGSEVNQESLKHVPELEVDDLDMDNVYD